MYLGHVVSIVTVHPEASDLTPQSTITVTARCALTYTSRKHSVAHDETRALSRMLSGLIDDMTSGTV